jgi:UDP-N-acetylglucosamine acyltransferase
MAMIDPTARIEPGALVGRDVSIGPYCIIGPDVAIGDGCRLLAHVHLAGHTTIGAGTVIYPFASLGTPPQSVKYKGGPTRLVVGTNCDIRESVTMSTGTEDAGAITMVGDRCFLMAGSHVGHDCRVGSDVTFANNAVLGGHVSVGDRAFLGVPDLRPASLPYPALDALIEQQEGRGDGERPGESDALPLPPR